MASRRILVIDDEENIGRSLRMILEREGYQVNSVGSAAETEPITPRAGVIDAHHAGVIDAHHHVWDLAVRDQPWIAGPEMAAIRRTFTHSSSIFSMTSAVMSPIRLSFAPTLTAISSIMPLPLKTGC